MDVSFFGEMAWKSALISGAALGLAFALRSRAASDRALVLRLGVAMLLLLPFIALALPALQIEAWAAPEPAPLPASLSPGARAPARRSRPMPGCSRPTPTIWDDPTPLVLLAYLGGLRWSAPGCLPACSCSAAGRAPAREVDLPGMAGGVRARPLGRARRRKAAAAGLRTRCPRRLSWGWRRPVILIDPDTLAEPDEADGDPRPRGRPCRPRATGRC